MNQKHYLKEKEINRPSTVFYENKENGNKTKPNL